MVQTEDAAQGLRTLGFVVIGGAIALGFIIIGLIFYYIFTYTVPGNISYSLFLASIIGFVFSIILYFSQSLIKAMEYIRAVSAFFGIFGFVLMYGAIFTSDNGPSDKLINATVLTIIFFIILVITGRFILQTAVDKDRIARRKKL